MRPRTPVRASASAILCLSRMRQRRSCLLPRMTDTRQTRSLTHEFSKQFQYRPKNYNREQAMYRTKSEMTV
eukprot:3871979-Pleurochrysis_carterae.AAC.2